MIIPTNPGRSESGIIRSSVNGAYIMCFIMFDLIRFVLDMSIRMLHPTPPSPVYPFIHLFIHSLTQFFYSTVRLIRSFISSFIHPILNLFFFCLAHPFVCTTINRAEPVFLVFV